MVQGLTGGTIWGVAAPVSAEVVGVENLASVLAVLWTVLVFPSCFAEVIALELLS